MRASDLRLASLIDLPAAGGIHRFAGERVLLFDAVALGLLRKELIEQLGIDAARRILTRFGYAHGWRTAERMRDALDWDSEDEWRIAGGRLHRLMGHVTFEPTAGETDCFAEATWHDSYEAEQHLLHLGRCEQCVCWTLTGFASGYMSFTNGAPIYCVETSCVGRGDAACHMVGRPRDAWGADAPAALRYYDERGLNAELEALQVALRQAETALRETQRQLDPDVPEHGIIARSAVMKQVIDLAQRVARVDATVLITGESGSGKERVARLVHDASPRAAGPFVAINCGAIAESLLESELFGHRKGAFTGASADRAGVFEEAAGGTLFLDEVGEIPLSMQVKLLRVLQEREVRRVGESRTRPIDVRIVAATHRDLEAAVREGSMREDFYYRIRVVALHVPPLRERPDDILPLARHLLRAAATRLRRPDARLGPDACRALAAHTWPGNVRELENALEFGLAVARADELDATDLPASVRRAAPAAQAVAHRSVATAHALPPSGSAATTPLAEVERQHILRALAAHDGNKAATARALGIGTATLFRRLRSYRDGT